MQCVVLETFEQTEQSWTVSGLNSINVKLPCGNSSEVM